MSNITQMFSEFFAQKLALRYIGHCFIQKFCATNSLNNCLAYNKGMNNTASATHSLVYANLRTTWLHYNAIYQYQKSRYNLYLHVSALK